MALTTPTETRPPNQELTSFDRGQILGEIKRGASQRQVAESLGCSRGAVRYTMKVLGERVNGATASRSGRPRKTTKEQDKALCDRLRSEPSILLHVLHQTMLPTVSFNTMQARLREEGLKMWKKKSRPFLNHQRAAQRLAWAKEHEHWTVAQWKRVLWSDECCVEKSAGQRSEWVYRASKDKWKPFAIQPTLRSSRASVQVWAAFSGRGRSRLVFCEGDPESARGGNTGRTYQRLLEQELPLLYHHDASGTFSTLFMHDNAPIHTANVVKNWLDESPYEIINWPPYSPDLNPIEHCWRPLKLNAHTIAPQLSTMTSKDQAKELLHQVLPGAWSNIPWSHFNKLIESMPRRIKAVIDAEGWYTKY